MEETSSEASPLTDLINKIVHLRQSILLIFLGFLLLLAGWRVYGYWQGQQVLGSLSSDAVPTVATSSALLTVDVSGAVVSPGVYRLSSGSRVEQAISAAGGFSSEADTEWVSKYLNQAAKLADGNKVYIPKKGQSNQGGSAANDSKSTININTASKEVLESLPQVGPATAENIIAGRPYSKVEDLVAKKALTQKTFDKIKDLLTIY